MTVPTKFRFGVGKRLILGYVGAALFTILAATIAIEALFEVRAGFEKFSNQREVASIAALQISQNSHSVTDLVADLVKTRNRADRKIVRARMDRHLSQIGFLTDQLKASDVDSAVLGQVETEMTAVASVIQSVANILAKQEVADALRVEQVRRVDALRHALTKSREQIESRYRDLLATTGPTGDQVALRAGDLEDRDIRDAGRQLEAMVRVVNVAEAAVDQLELTLNEGRKRHPSDPSIAYGKLMVAINGQWPQIIAKNNSLVGTIDEIVEGLRWAHNPDDGVFVLHEQSGRILNDLNTNTVKLRGQAARLMAVVPNVIGVARAIIKHEYAAFEYLLGSRIAALSMVVVLCLLLVGAVSVLVRRGIVQRLMGLQRTMHEHTLGNDPKIDIDGSDEIADMARSFAFFVDAVKYREQEQKISEQRFLDIARAASDWFWETDVDHNFTYFSDQFEAIMGISAQGQVEVGRTHAADWMTHAPELLNNIEIMTARQPFRDHRHSMTDTRGELHHIKSSGHPIFDDDGTFAGYRGSSTDITGEVLARAQLSAAIEVMPGAFALWDEHDRLVTFNSLFSHFHASFGDAFHAGVSFEELTRTIAESGFVIDAQGRENEFIENRMAHHRHCTGSSVHTYQNGLTVQIREAKTADGETVTVMTDITAGRRTERDLQDALDRYQQLADDSLHGIIVHRGLTPLYMNNACADILGLTPKSDGLPIDNLGPFLAEDQLKIFQNYARSVLKEGFTRQFLELECRRIDGRPIWLMVSVKRINWGEGKAVQTLMYDLTDRRKIEGELRLAKDEAERANYAKTRFLAAASHDLRQPLHAMGLFVSSLAESLEGNSDGKNGGRLTDRDQKTIRNIEEAQKTVESLLESLLDISKLDAGILKPEIQVFSYTDMISSLERTFASTVMRKKLHLRFMPSSVMLKSDPFLLARIVSNMVSNAIQYTETGRILVGCRRVGPRVRIECHDTGKGIPADKLEEIFYEFHRLEGPSMGQRQGFGLGLAIVKRVAQLLDHPISVNSEINRGSTFTVEVPVGVRSAKTELPMLPVKDLASLEKPLILAIDDDSAVLEGMKVLVEGWGYGIYIANSADEAIEALGVMEKIPTLIIADYRLAERQTGTDAIERVTRHLKRQIPAVIVTGDTAPERLQEAKESGFLLLHKPLQPAKLRQVIRTTVLRREN